MALPTVEVSPGCVQQPDRAFDPTPLADTIRSARAAFPGRVVRPLVLYANNVELALPPRIVNGLAQLRSDASQDGVEPWMYAVGLMDPAGTPFDRTVRWSHGTDPALWNGLRSLLDADLPFQSRRGGTFSAPLLDASLGAAGTLYRICSSSGGVRVSGCAAGPSAPCGLPPPPTATVTFTPVLALPGSVPPARAVVTYEACTVRCERFVDADGDLVPWTDLGGCSGARP
jgi:hypothetical protein